MSPSRHRLRRFLHLERPRGERAEPEPGAGETGPAPGRFEGVERPGARPPEAADRSGAHLDRFGPEPEPRIELVEAEGRRPFTRCRRCGMDSNVFATTCGGCGAAFDTAEQREFDERFWARREAEAAREAAAAAERRMLRERAAAEDAVARRAAYEALAREVGEAERRRLAAEGLGEPGPGELRYPGGAPLAWRLLRVIPDPRWRAAVAVAGAVALGALVLGGLASVASGGRAPALGLGAALLAILFLPPRLWRRRRRWWR